MTQKICLRLSVNVGHVCPLEYNLIKTWEGRGKKPGQEPEERESLGKAISKL